MNPLDRLQITPEIVRLIGEIELHRGLWEYPSQKFAARLAENAADVEVNAVHASLTLDGVAVGRGDVEGVLVGSTGGVATSVQQSIRGYASARRQALLAVTSTPTNEQFIADLLSMLDGDGRFESHRAELAALLRGARAEGAVHHSLLRVAEFSSRFAALDPCGPHSAAMQRLLTVRQLVRAGYECARHRALEAVWAAHADEFRRVDSRARAARGDSFDLEPWLVFFLRSVLEMSVDLLQLVERGALAVRLGEVDERILAHARSHGRVTVRDVVAASGMNRNTVKAHMRRLATVGHLARHGSGRGTWYELG